MPKNPNVKKVMVIGSGPIVIGQAAEFDYAGTQACRSLKEEGIEVVLVNSNPATIMTESARAEILYKPRNLTISLPSFTSVNFRSDTERISYVCKNRMLVSVNYL